MDVAASEFCKDGPKYDLDFKNPESKPADWITSDQLCEMYKGFIQKYPIVSLEDVFDQDDWAGWCKLSSKYKFGRFFEKFRKFNGFNSF